MALTAYGVDQSITEPKWALLMAILGKGSYDETIATTGGQLAPTVASGTRVVDVDDGDLVAAGVLVQNTTTVTVTLDGNSGSLDRIDTIVCEINWSGTSSTGASIKAIKGTPAANPVPPTLTRTAGTLWQVPIARVTVTPGVGQLPGGVLEDVRPGARLPKVYKTTAANGQSTSGGGGGTQIASIDVPDPGWPYRLQIAGVQKFAQLSDITNGRGQVQAVISGSQITVGEAARGNLSAAVLRTEVTPVRTGPATVNFRMQGVSISGEQLVTTGSQESGFTVLVIPA